jgi:hypothetical protein
LIVILAAMGAPLREAIADGGTNPGVLPFNSSPYGSSYAEWSARHWQWVYSLPADAHPLTDTADCSTGQTGHVWFLGGTFAPSEIAPNVFLGQADRDCAIPTGTALFFPIVDVESSVLEGNGTTEAELSASSKFLADFIDPASLFVEIDGQPLSNLPGTRTQSPLFTFGPLPANNLLGAAAGSTSPSVSDGYFIMLAPLSAGEHTIHFGGTLDASSIGGPIFIEDITYHLVVGKP